MSIMVPLDTSEVGRSALPKAEELAKALGQSLLLVTVADDDTIHAVSELARIEGQDPIDFLELNLRSRARAVSVPAETDLLPGQDPASAIVDRAHQPDVDMIVMATHGRTGLSRWRLGSVAERVVRAATVPVLVIPAPWRVKETPASMEAAEA
ncbi:MAG: universal stress protein [Actinomycetes bacterium]|jgi:nucleotide-binding universal stress UspA family protein|nr:universal stress protein [Acidimicrobiia bacterium]